MALWEDVDKQIAMYGVASEVADTLGRDLVDSDFAACFWSDGYDAVNLQRPNVYFQHAKKVDKRCARRNSC